MSKQAVCQARKRQQQFDMELMDLIKQVDIIRKVHPGCGVEKMYKSLKPKFMGRDKFCEVFMELGYRVKTPKNYTRTTIPAHLDYPNLIAGMAVIRPYQVIQSDITYIADFPKEIHLSSCHTSICKKPHCVQLKYPCKSRTYKDSVFLN